MSESAEQVKKELVAFKPFEDSLKEFKAKYDGVVYNLSDIKQEKQARSDQYAIGVVIGNLDRKHKVLKAPLSYKVKLIDGKRKEIKDDLRSVQQKIKSQIEQHETAIAEHEAKLQLKFDAISDLVVFNESCTPTSDEISQRLAKVHTINVDGTFEHLEYAAGTKWADVVEELGQMFELAVAAEREAERLAKEAKETAAREAKERDERLKAEAAETARIEAERKAANEIARIEAEKQQVIIDAEIAKKRAEQDAIAAENAANQRAKQAVVMERQRAMQKAAEQAAKVKAEQDVIAAQKAEKEHVALVVSEIKCSLMGNGLDQKCAQLVIELLRAQKIAHVKIDW